MTIYYVKQDDSYVGCSEPGCCGESYEATEESFVKCDHEIPEAQMTADHLQGCKGGGEVLKWRKAKHKEILAFKSGKDDGFSEGSDWGIEWQKNKEANKIKTDAQRSVHELVHLGYKVTVDGSKLGKSINHYTEYSDEVILESPLQNVQGINNFGITVEMIDDAQNSISGTSFSLRRQVYTLDVGGESVEITPTMAFGIANAIDEYKQKISGDLRNKFPNP